MRGVRDVPVLLALVILGCGSEEAPASIAPEPAPAVTTSEAAPPDPPAVPTPAPDVELEVFSVPSDWRPSTDALAVSTRTLSDESIDIRIPVLGNGRTGGAAALNAYVESTLESAARRVAGGDYIFGSCVVTLARTELVSMLCTVSGSGARSGVVTQNFAVSAGLVAGAAQPVVVRDAFAPDVDFTALADGACRAAAGEAGHADWCDEATYEVTLAPSGLRVHVLNDGTLDALDLTVGYDDPALAGHLLLDGPLAAFLPIGERASRAFSPDEILAAELRARCDVGWAVGPTRPLIDVLLGADREADVRIRGLVEAEDGFRPVYQTCVRTADDYRAAEALARSLAPGGAIELLPQGTSLLAIQRYLTTEELTLRAAPSADATYLSAVPPATRVMGIEGTFDGHPSTVGGPGTWTRVAIGDGVGGWMASRYLRAHAGRCGRPSAAQITAALPAAAAGAPVTLSEHEGSLVVSARGRERSWVAVSDACSLVPVQRTITVPGRIESVRWLGGRDASSAVVITSTAADVGEPGFDGVLRIMLVAPEAAEPGWSMDAPSHATLPSRQRAVIETDTRASGAIWDVAVRIPGAGVRRVRWDGGAFVESTGR